MHNTSPPEYETMRTRLARLGAALDKWSAEQRLRKWAGNLADGTPSDQVNPTVLGRSDSNR